MSHITALVSPPAHDQKAVNAATLADEDTDTVSNCCITPYYTRFLSLGKIIKFTFLAKVYNCFMYTSAELENQANTVPARSDLDDYRETCERMYHRAVTEIQLQLDEGRRQMESLIPDVSLVQVQIVSVESAPVYDFGNDIAGELVGSDIKGKIAELEQDAKTAIEAQKKLLDYRLENANRVIGCLDSKLP
jgi:hypothetical protein